MKYILLILVVVSLLVACGSPAATGIAESQGEPTSLPEPTSPPTATPVPLIFRDEFSGELAPEWQWVNEDPERWFFTEEGWLALKAGSPSVLAQEGTDIRQINLLTMPAPDGSFTLTTRVMAAPSHNFQQATLYLLDDAQNYVAALIGFCEPCLPETGGYGFFMEAYKNGENLLERPFLPREPDVTDVYLRLDYDAAASRVTGYYAAAPDDWQEMLTVEGVSAFSLVGIGASNAPGPSGSQGDLMAFFDYVEINRAEAPVLTGPLPKPTQAPPTPVPTPLPEGILFRDDFNGALAEGWEWYNEDPSRRSFTDDGWLTIQAGNEGFYGGGSYSLVNFLARELPEGDFMITTHVKADPRLNFHQATIYIFENPSNYIALNTGFCDLCLPGGHGFFMETIIDNNPFGDAYAISRPAGATDVYLRLINQSGSLTGYYALEPDNWQRVGAFGNYFDFRLVGLGATNSNPGGVAEDLTAMFDYFEIARP